MVQRKYATRELDRASLIIWYIFTIIESLLVIRFAFKMLGANPESTVVDFVYSITDFFMVPFRGIFPEREIADGLIVDLSALTALVFYLLISFAILRFIDYAKEGKREDVLNAGREERKERDREERRDREDRNRDIDRKRDRDRDRDRGR